MSFDHVYAYSNLVIKSQMGKVVQSWLQAALWVDKLNLNHEAKFLWTQKAVTVETVRGMTVTLVGFLKSSTIVWYS